MEQRERWQVFRDRHGVWVGTQNGTERCEIVAVMGDGPHTERQVSNAHLVAAAPALLEAARDAFLLLQVLQLVTPDDEDGSLASVLGSLRAAIMHASRGA